MYENPPGQDAYFLFLIIETGNPPQPSSTYGAFYPPGQSVAYTHPSATVHGSPSVYSSYNTNRDSIEVLHKSQPVAPPPPTPPQHSSLYAPHRSSIPGPSPIQSANHVCKLCWYYSIIIAVQSLIK